MNDAEQKKHDLDVQIAANEAQRQTMSDVRVSTWAIVLALLVVALAGWLVTFM